MMNPKIPPDLLQFCKEHGHCNNLADCDGACLKYINVLPTPSQPVFSKSDKATIEEEVKTMRRNFHARQRQLNSQGWTEESVAQIAIQELVEDSLPQPQRQFENQLEKCSQTGTVTCPHPDCFFIGLCGITNKKRGER